MEASSQSLSPWSIDRDGGQLDLKSALAVEHLELGEQRGSVFIPPGLSREEKPKLHEVATMKRLTHLGFCVSWRGHKPSRDGTRPDISMEQKVWDLKAPQGSGKHNASEQMRTIRHQTDRGVIDLVRLPQNESEYAREVARRLILDRRILEIIILFTNGSGLRLAKRGMIPGSEGSATPLRGRPEAEPM